MVTLGYTLSGEEHKPNDLVRYAQKAESLGFEFVSISDHFHPWVDKQGESVFVWGVIGGVAHATDRISLGTGVTCPTVRIHPAIIAQAAATAASMMPGRFYLGVGTGENLNEHILGDHWPAYDQRAEMLEEAVDVIRMLWEGESVTYYGNYYTVENARIYTLPDKLPPIMVAAAGEKSAELASRIGDGLVMVSADADIVEQFRSGSPTQRPVYGQITVCCHEDAEEARKIAHEWWPNAGIQGEISQMLPTPAHFEQVAKLVREEDVAESVVCGNDVDAHRAKIQEYIDAGIDHVYIHQVGPDQDVFFDFYEKHILPHYN